MFQQKKCGHFTPLIGYLKALYTCTLYHKIMCGTTLSLNVHGMNLDYKEFLETEVAYKFIQKVKVKVKVAYIIKWYTGMTSLPIWH